MNLEVKTVPDPILLMKLPPVSQEELASPHTQQLIDAMLTFVRRHDGVVGLAANQVGYKLRIIVAYSGGLDYNCYINPEIPEASTSQSVASEGCLSLPGQRFWVTRPDDIVLRALNRDGNLIEDWVRSYPARVVQHETDHVDGILISRHGSGPIPEAVDKFVQKIFS